MCFDWAIVGFFYFGSKQTESVLQEMSWVKNEGTSYSGNEVVSRKAMERLLRSTLFPSVDRATEVYSIDSTYKMSIPEERTCIKKLLY